MLLELNSMFVDKDEFSEFTAWQATTHLEREKAFDTKFCNWYWLSQNFSLLSIDEARQALQYEGYSTVRKTKKVMTAMLESLERGVPYYPDCKKSELLQFAVDRGLASGRNKSITKQTLVQRLDRSDKNPAFPKFESLPPEIRNKIYVFHFSSVTARLFAPAQPPITMANRLLRKESLPLFYNTCNFGMPLLCGGWVMPTPAAPTNNAREPGAEVTRDERENQAPVNGICDREHHHIHADDIDKYMVLQGSSSFALLPNYIARWHSKVYRKYHKDISDIALLLPHACLDLHFGFNKKQNKMDYYVHGHCDLIHGDDCDNAFDTLGVFSQCFQYIQAVGYLDKRMLKKLWSEVDEIGF